MPTTTPIETLKGWFRSLKMPTQAQFWAWLDSYRHKDDKIDINDLETLLATKIQYSITQEQMDAQFAFLNPITGTCNGIQIIEFSDRTTVRELEILSNVEGVAKAGIAADTDEYGIVDFTAGGIATILINRAFKAGEGFFISTTSPAEYLIRKA